MMTFENIIKNSGDSILKEYQFTSGVVKVVMYNNELEKEISLEATTDSIKGIDLSQFESFYKTCHIEAFELENDLRLENGYFIPSVNFATLMKECKNGLNLAYGKKHVDSKFLISFKGYETFLQFIIKDKNDVLIKTLK